MTSPLVSYFCVDCGSPAVDLGSIIGGDARCRSCGWRGPQRALGAHTFSTDLGTREAAMEAFARALMGLLGKNAVEFGRFLLEFGFLSHPVRPARLRRYLEVIARSVVQGCVETREAELRETLTAPPTPGAM